MSHLPLDRITPEQISAAGVPSEDSHALHAALRRILRDHGSSAPDAWSAISRQILSPDLPFFFHQLLYYGCYARHPDSTPPAWLPTKETAASTNIGRVLLRQGKDPVSGFSEFQEFSVSKPEVYWKLVFEEMGVEFSVPPECMLREDSAFPGGKWLPGAYMNSAGSCLRLSGKRGPDEVAVVWRDEGSDSLPVNRMTVKELKEQVCLVANALDMLGLAKGSSIAIDMPMNVNAVVIYLAIVLAGYVVVSIADSFAAREISTRLKISMAKAIFTQDYIVHGDKELLLYSRVVDAQAPMAIVIPIRGYTFTRKLRGGDISWHDFLEKAKRYKAYEYTAVEQPIEAFTNILFSSGTTVWLLQDSCCRLALYHSTC